MLTRTRAADRMHITQPELTKRLRLFEDVIAARLFERDRTGTVLTSIGKALLPDALRIIPSRCSADSCPTCRARYGRPAGYRVRAFEYRHGAMAGQRVPTGDFWCCPALSNQLPE
ncbi:hypothetical protein XarbCFBP8132_06845 [Xanthomonas arboricola]|uniref:helix-turn-helix domain-containing protein n=1 Tax=Xanthomonas arboricola TaxID=56448 RepID=UPI000CEEBBE3|nr:hypothetical protein XarbCFBP8132_06845 [Xanthomonas arboricola]